jgi:hypothetical protein
MKIINSNIFQVLYYHYYLFQKWINGGIADFMALNMLTMFTSFIIISVLVLIFSFISKYWIGFILGVGIALYLSHYLDKVMLDEGFAKKIIKKKPKIGNSNFLSIVFTILFTVLTFLALAVGGSLAGKINDGGIHLIK